uniref:Uncharacterized protein n=1 Tax=Calcidiscus leptoporus TaxID=127549 RepID=A0A7S0IS46_9EUKA|mmetsp:Transcript_19967/g.46060  ORF Transcript_19967/g.46060 Transcript_19967/m.46060 type:complete len:131 (+) Transcript_19967:48-440(+)
MSILFASAVHALAPQPSISWIGGKGTWHSGNWAHGNPWDAAFTQQVDMCGSNKDSVVTVEQPAYTQASVKVCSGNTLRIRSHLCIGSGCNGPPPPSPPSPSPSPLPRDTENTVGDPVYKDKATRMVMLAS